MQLILVPIIFGGSGIRDRRRDRRTMGEERKKGI
jgi:hypothetical protein